MPTSRCGFFDCVGLCLESGACVTQTRGVRQCGDAWRSDLQHLINVLFYIYTLCDSLRMLDDSLRLLWPSCMWALRALQEKCGATAQG